MGRGCFSGWHDCRRGHSRAAGRHAGLWLCGLIRCHPRRVPVQHHHWPVAGRGQCQHAVRAGSGAGSVHQVRCACPCWPRPSVQLLPCTCLPPLTPAALFLPNPATRSSMARRTLGDAGATAVSLTYALLHFALLVACERGRGRGAALGLLGPRLRRSAAAAAPTHRTATCPAACRHCQGRGDAAAVGRGAAVGRRRGVCSAVWRPVLRLPPRDAGRPQLSAGGGGGGVVCGKPACVRWLQTVAAFSLWAELPGGCLHPAAHQLATLLVHLRAGPGGRGGQRHSARAAGDGQLGGAARRAAGHRAQLRVSKHRATDLVAARG